MANKTKNYKKNYNFTFLWLVANFVVLLFTFFNCLLGCSFSSSTGEENVVSHYLFTRVLCGRSYNFRCNSLNVISEQLAIKVKHELVKAPYPAVIKNALEQNHKFSMTFDDNLVTFILNGRDLFIIAFIKRFTPPIPGRLPTGISTF